MTKAQELIEARIKPTNEGGNAYDDLQVVSELMDDLDDALMNLRMSSRRSGNRQLERIVDSMYRTYKQLSQDLQAAESSSGF